MARCSYCGEQATTPYTCNYCGSKHCSSHRLPENHGCVGLYPRDSKHFEGDTSKGTGEQGESDPVQAAENVGTVGTSSQPDFEDSPDTELKEGKSHHPPAGSRLERITSIAIGLGAILLLTPARLISGVLRGIFRRRRALTMVLFVGAIGAAAAIAGPVELGDYLGPQGEQVDDSVEGVVGGVVNWTKNAGNETEGVLNSLGPEEMNESRLELLVHEQINEVRRNHSLSPLAWEPELQEIADYHSEEMADRGYFAHESPCGGGFDYRYEKFGYECRVDVGDVYYSGAENILKSYYGTEVRGGYGDGSYDTLEEMANAVVYGWMSSQGHRENILKPFWRVEGIGVATTKVDGETVVYVTQNFC